MHDYDQGPLQIVAKEIKDEVLAKGGRFDHEKVRFDLLEPTAIKSLAEVFTIGAKKYADNNWIEHPMAWSRIIASLYRHLNAFQQGEDFDPETGLSHAAHVAWNAMALTSYFNNKCGKDDRRRSKEHEEQ